MERRFGSSLLLSCLVAVLVVGSTQSMSSRATPDSRSPASAEASSVAIPVTKTSTAVTKKCGPQSAWVGAGSDGVACLDAAGWKLFDESAPSPRLGFVKDIAVSRTGVVWIVSSSGLFSTNGGSWTKHEVPSNPSFDAVACDSKGRVWLGGYNIVAFYDGSKMTTYPVSNLGKGKFVNQVKDVAVAPDGRVWFASANSVATYDGSTWKYFEKGHGFDKEYFVNKLVVDSRGHVWVATSSDILSYDGQSWTSANSDYWQAQALAVDRQNRLWVATYSKGVAMFDGQSWTMYDRTNSGLPSNKVESIALDSQRRVWIGTEWGLAVLAGTTWKSYHVSDADIPANQVSSLGIVGNGPKLPPKMSKKPGGLKGRLVRSGTPQAGLTVEICVEYVGTLLTSTTPCSEQPFSRATKTRADGWFGFSGLPAGDYVITFQNPDGKWLVVSSQYGLGSSSQEVLSGKTTNVGELDLAKST